jgi:hypothetical protein
MSEQNMSAKILVILGMAACVVATPALAGDAAQPFVMAQQNMNPTNDPDVQRGIDQRQEQERQRKIQECYDERTAQMNPKPAGADALDIRRECEHWNTYGGAGIRG